MALIVVNNVADLMSEINDTIYGTIVLMPGIYSISTSLLIKRPLSLVGLGSTIIKLSAAQSHAITVAEAGNQVNNVTLANLSIVCTATRSSGDALSCGVLAADANLLALEKLTISNFTSAVELRGSSAVTKIRECRLENILTAGCDNGIVFSGQTELLIRNFTETGGQAIKSGNQPHAIFGDSTVANGTVSIRNAQSFGHPADYPFQFNGGDITISGLKAENAGGLLKMTQSASGTLSDLSLVGWEAVGTTNVGLHLSEAGSIFLDGANFVANDSQGLTGVLIDNAASGAINTIRSASLTYNVGSDSFMPYRVVSTPGVSFIDCRFKNSGMSSPYVFHFQGSSYGYVLAPQAIGWNKIVSCDNMLAVGSSNCKAVFNKSTITYSSTLNLTSSGASINNEANWYSGDFQILPATGETILSSDPDALTINLAASTTLVRPETRRTVNKIGSGTARITVSENSVQRAWLTAQDDWATFVFHGANWIEAGHQIAPLRQWVPATDGSSRTVTYDKPPLASKIAVTAIGAGGGGGAGQRASTGQRFGGGGGAGGSIVSAVFLSSDIGTGFTMTAGDGGPGGAGQSSNANGPDGQVGYSSSFGTYLVARGGAPGRGTVLLGAGGAPVLAEANLGTTGAGGSSSKTADAAAGGAGVCGGGGGGGGASSTGMAFLPKLGGTGSAPAAAPVNGGAAGISGTVNGSAGDPAARAETKFGGGGGGGGYPVTSGTAGSGGTGGFPGGGGGGGGAGAGSGTTSGSGRAGGAGQIQVVTFF